MAAVKLSSKSQGSIVKLKEDGKLVEFYVAKHNYESGLNGNGRTLLVRKECYDKRQWHSTGNNAYASSSINSWLNNSYKNLLDPSIRAAMGTTKIYYTIGYGNDTKSTLERGVFLLSATELGQSGDRVPVQGSVLPIANILKIAYLNGVATIQWTRTSRYESSHAVWYLDAKGNLDPNSTLADRCDNYYASRPAFTLPSNFYISDDGTVTDNTAPSTPPSISLPNAINGGSTITISWGASSDAEGNLEGYIVQRSVNGGSTWTQIYQGSGRSTNNTVAFGTSSVIYRVKAYDTEELESGWKTSAQVTVVNNVAPSAPASLTVPNTVDGGKSLTVTWGRASDSDGNLSGYALERQVDGGAWTEVYRGDKLSFADPITKGWGTVAYRVRAFDSLGACSEYVTSAVQTVNNNTAPVITCSSPNGSDLGLQNDGFSVVYSVSDVDGDSVTVTEAVDGVPLRTLHAVLGESYAVELTGLDFMRVLNGAHTLTITASDGIASTVHTLTFSKLVTAASVTLEAPMPADAPITLCVLSVAGSIPLDADYSVKVTNNGNDPEPAWEYCTAAVKNGVNHVFANETAENGFAFNFRVEVERGASGLGGYITSVQGGFQ